MKFGMVAMLLASLGTACAMGPEGDPNENRTEDLTGAASVTDGAIACNAATSVKVSISGTNVTSITPVDLMLVVDESGSIDATEFAQQKSFLSAMVSGLGVLFQNGGRVGLSMFSGTSQRWPGTNVLKGTSRIVAPLTASQAQIQSSISSVAPLGGNTCIGCGVADGVSQLGSDPARRRVMVVLTDGVNNATRTTATNATEDLKKEIAAAQAAGITVFAVGVGNSLDQAQLQIVATGDGNQNVYNVADFNQLRSILEALIAAVVTPEATNAKLVLDVNGAFTVCSPTADSGAVALSGNQISWTIPEIEDGTVTLTYDVQHLPIRQAGQKPIHTTVTYTDDQGNQLSLPDVSVTIFGCDQDSDGVLDEQDACADTPAGASPIDPNGCTVGQLCPCDAEKNHGQYVSCVGAASKTFVDDGLLTAKERATMVSDAAGGACIE